LRRSWAPGSGFPRRPAPPCRVQQLRQLCRGRKALALHAKPFTVCLHELNIDNAVVPSSPRGHRARTSNRRCERERELGLHSCLGPLGTDAGSRTRPEPASCTRGMGMVQAEQTMAKASQGGPLGSRPGLWCLWPLASGLFDPTHPSSTHTWPSACPRGRWRPTRSQHGPAKLGGLLVKLINFKHQKGVLPAPAGP
jgi:hypothetical protein